MNINAINSYNLYKVQSFVTILGFGQGLIPFSFNRIS
ncbi:hypothetical protein CLV98_101621 [Dyadobacter jejuensis]|uniref:Uncharacterized protein n=1 Tax=Dyadobacter jejuensis TaxID=1082580 RepID=A0A316BD74_9BACT|nr:hypothetical protein CLV98_101621 [Dyadobacter jejuensis]